MHFSYIIAIFALIAINLEISSANIKIRTRRQVEREGKHLNETTSVVSGDRDVTTEYENVEPVDESTDVMEVDFSPKDGTFTFGGRFPSLFDKDFSNHFDDVFRQMTRRFQDMSRHMFERFNTTSAQYPDNYNGTKEEIVTIDGKQYIKKEHVIKKSNDNMNIFLTTTSYEPINTKENES